MTTGPSATWSTRALVITPYALCLLALVLFIDAHLRGDPMKFGAEDGPLEWGTVFFFLVCAVTCVVARIANKATLPRREGRLLIVFAVVLLVGIGEELSWGQRIFGWDPPEAIARENGGLIAAGHDDTTLHNLSFRSEHLKFSIGGLIFGVPMLIAVGMHGIWLPIAYRNGDRRAVWLVERLGVFRPPVVLGTLACATATVIYICRKALDTDVQANEFIELVIPMVYAFILMGCYFSGGRRIDRIMNTTFFVLVVAWFGMTVAMVANQPSRKKAAKKPETAWVESPAATTDAEPPRRVPPFG